MEKLKTMRIRSYKKYLILSKSSSFLEKARKILENKLNISDIYETKRHKNSMTFDTIILKNGGFIKFFLYNNNLMKCAYDVVLVDSALYAAEYSTIRSNCLFADIIAVVESDNLEDIEPQFIKIEYVHNKVMNRKFSPKNFCDYGDCPECGTIVYGYDKVCPMCDVELDWTLSKDDIIALCLQYGDFDDSLGVNLMHCNENWYNRYYCILHTFGLDRLKEMSEDELKDLLTLTDNITQGLY